jgi:hypothetical protein
MKRGFLDLLDPSNDPEFFWQVISGPPCIVDYCHFKSFVIETFVRDVQTIQNFKIIHVFGSSYE